MRVEIANPRITMATAQQPPSPVLKEHSPENSPRRNSIDIDSPLKLAALVIALIQACLLVIGYMHYQGIMELYEISRTEVSFSFSDLLACGYGALLQLSYSSDLRVIFSISLIYLAVIGVIAVVWRGGSFDKKAFISWVLATLVSFATLAPILLGYQPGKETALVRAAEHLQVDSSKISGLQTTQEVASSDGPLTGDVILATQESTFLLSGKILYKIRASDSKVVRKTYLEAKLK